MNIILYTTHCPKCSVLEKKLKEANIIYCEVNDVNLILDAGIEEVPVLQVGDNIMGFADAVKWINSQEDN